MKKGIILVTVVLLIISIRCNDDEVATFVGITETNELGVVVGQVDQTDWVLDEVWSDQEIQLFDGVSENSLNNNGTAIDFSQFPSIINQTPVFPNPNRGLFSFNSIDDDFTEGKFVLVDNRYNILIGPISLNAGSSILFEIEVQNQSASFFQSTSPTGSTSTVTSGQVLRAYYYYRMPNDDVYLKGHGDILFQ